MNTYIIWYNPKDLGITTYTIDENYKGKDERFEYARPNASV